MAGISITLAGNFQKLDELKEKAKKTAGSIKDSFKDGLGGKAFAGLSVAAAASFAAVVASLKSAIDAGGELQDMMTKTGASGKGLLILEQAFKNAGLAASDVGGAIGRLQKAMAGLNEDGEPTNEAFSKLKLNLDDLIAMDPAEALEKVGAALGSVEDPAQRTATAMQLFGKSGANLLAVFNDSGAIEQAKTQLGGLTETLPGMAGDFDSVGDAFGALDVKVTQFGTGLAAELIPNLKDAAEWINNLDLTEYGSALGIIINKVSEWADALSPVVEYLKMISGYSAMSWVADKLFNGELTDEDRAKAKQMAESWAKNDPNAMKSGDQREAEKKQKVENFKEAAATAAAPAKKQEAEKAAKDAEKKAEADKKAAEEKEKSRAAAADEYRLEMAIAKAKESGDTDRLAKLEREKKIREEIKRLEGAGFSAAEARKPAEAKVDAEKRAEDLEAKRKDQAEQKKKEIESIQDRLKELGSKKDGLHFESSVGKVSDMQRVGGGGGAVGSGLDYARQQNDILREILSAQKELVRASGTRDTEV